MAEQAGQLPGSAEELPRPRPVPQPRECLQGVPEAACGEHHICACEPQTSYHFGDEWRGSLTSLPSQT